MSFETIADEYFNHYTPPVWLDDYPAERFAHVVYSLPGAQMLQAVGLARQRKAGYIYLTEDILDNPYDVLASYWAEQVEAAQGLIFADGFESGDFSFWVQP